MTHHAHSTATGVGLQVRHAHAHQHDPVAESHVHFHTHAATNEDLHRAGKPHLKKLFGAVLCSLCTGE